MPPFSARRNSLLEAIADERGRGEAGVAAALILRRMGPEDPEPEDDALACILAIGLHDLHVIRSILQVLAKR
jgi:hypothetical protein